jgi:Xaa-Pro aminopeptidase
MNKTDEFSAKLEAVSGFLRMTGLDGVILRRAENFAWLGCGANNLINNAEETGVASLVVHGDKVLLLANNIETERMFSEELAGLPITDAEVFAWHEPAARGVIISRLAGATRLAADDGSEGLPPVPDGFAQLRYALTECEVARYQELGRDATVAVESSARQVEAGMTEADVAALMADQLRRRNITPIVLLVAAQGRIETWRHPPPKMETVQRCAMLVTCGRRDGLIAAITRLVHLGPVPPEFARRHRAVCAVDATAIGATTPGRRASDLFATIQEAYAANGFPDEWTMHHQGGATGYRAREYIVNADCEETVRANQAFGWNPSICGTKSEDTMLATDSGPCMLTEPGDGWPTLEFEQDGVVLRRADILGL